MVDEDGKMDDGENGEGVGCLSLSLASVGFIFGGDGGGVRTLGSTIRACSFLGDKCNFMLPDSAVSKQAVNGDGGGNEELGLKFGGYTYDEDGGN